MSAITMNKVSIGPYPSYKTTINNYEYELEWFQAEQSWFVKCISSNLDKEVGYGIHPNHEKFNEGALKRGLINILREERDKRSIWDTESKSGGCRYLLKESKYPVIIYHDYQDLSYLLYCDALSIDEYIFKAPADNKKRPLKNKESMDFDTVEEKAMALIGATIEKKMKELTDAAKDHITNLKKLSFCRSIGE